MKKLSLSKMENLEGGVSREEYCGTLQMLYDNNKDSWSSDQIVAATSAAGLHCGGIL